MWTWSSWLAFLPTTMISYLCDFCVISCISHFYWSRALRNSSFIFFVCPRIIFRTTRHCLLAWGWWSTSSSFALQHSFFPITFVPMKGSVYLWNQQAINSKYLKLLILITTLRGEKSKVLSSDESCCSCFESHDWFDFHQCLVTPEHRKRSHWIKPAFPQQFSGSLFKRFPHIVILIYTHTHTQEFIET